ncbi:phosphotransferase family protein [Kribbella sp. NPDC004875]|uniref:phosphotransferase family protein n=1 Tax=Kribbella sp. NPDC004875 TaxID=3364107 RepID=UPI003687F9C8
MPNYVKRRPPAVPGSIPDVLKMFQSEVRFYTEIAPVVGVRVPECYQAEQTVDGTLLVLEDLSAWTPGAAPDAGARALRELHDRWVGRLEQWPWIRPIGAGEDLVAALYDEAWPAIAARSDLSPAVLEFGQRLVGKVQDVDRVVATAGPLTLVHGDASAQNLRTGPNGEVAFLDWEDVSAAPGVLDLAWFLVSSVEPAAWSDALNAYGPVDGLRSVLPSVMVQGYLSVSDLPDGAATAWNARLGSAVGML